MPVYRSMRDVVHDLEKHGQLIRIREEVDPNLVMASIHRRVFDAGGPAILFEKVKGSPFQAVSNIYGTFERTEWLFRDTLDKVQRIVELKADPARFLRNPSRYLGASLHAFNGLPRKSLFGSPVKYGETIISLLPQIKSWPMDGGAFVTMPQVFTRPPGSNNIMESNLGMYRIQLSGNEYVQDKEIGLHYQLHRGIGVHHRAYQDSDEPFRASVIVGGPPSYAFSAIMPLPEGLSEWTFAGLLAGRAVRYALEDGFTLASEADFVITGTIRKRETKPEGPFGDHLGYYSLEHPFPVMDVHKVHHRKDAIWHFSVVGRPPMEDSSFGHLIHKIVKDLTPTEFPGVREIHAVDAAGVHPLLLAIGNERYMPFREKKPEEILTIANRILGSGQTSLAKYLIIADGSDYPTLACKNIAEFLGFVLERVDWRRDLHFQTRTTIDTLDYSGTGWNAGSKLVIAAAGKSVRNLTKELPTGIEKLGKCSLVLPGIMAIKGDQWQGQMEAEKDLEELIGKLGSFPDGKWSDIPVVVLCDDPDFLSQSLNNFLWVTFTRSNPSHDVYGVGSFTDHKHWGCVGSLIIDARAKKHHAPDLVEDDWAEGEADGILGRVGF
jgi:4-hydroxy-3-polyprenylbenzoate decarboxylase